jgi:hypothetical protein
MSLSQSHSGSIQASGHIPYPLELMFTINRLESAGFCLCCLNVETKYDTIIKWTLHSREQCAHLHHYTIVLDTVDIFFCSCSAIARLRKFNLIKDRCLVTQPGAKTPRSPPSSPSLPSLLFGMQYHARAHHQQQRGDVPISEAELQSQIVQEAEVLLSLDYFDL